ncbi:MAG: HAMP domain-containing sensor histidine kinase [Arcobacteraceae bacterium]
MKKLFKHYRNSIALHLLTVIFGFYFLVAILVTVIQLYKEYQNTKAEFYEEIQTLPATFGKGITDSVWTYNKELLHSILQGMYNLPIVVGLKVESFDHKMDLQVGAVLDKQNNVIYFDSLGKPTTQEVSGIGTKSLFSHQFPIYYQGTGFEDSIPLGNVTLYSNDQLVFERVKYGFFLILINSLVKTFALWFIIYYFIRKYLGVPLDEFTSKIHNQNVESPQLIDLDIRWTDKNELLILQDSYNQMIFRLNQYRIEEEKLQASQKMLLEQSRFNSIGKSIGNITHQWKHPLSQLGYRLSTLETVYRHDKENFLIEYEKSIPRLNNSLEMMSSTIDQFTKFYSGNMIKNEFSPKEVLIDNIIPMIEAKVFKKEVKFDIDIKEDLKIFGYKSIFANIMMILIDNSLDAYEKSDKNIIKISIVKENENFKIIFIDNAGGIKVEPIEKVFEPLFTTKESNGNGLGLNMVKMLAEEQLQSSVNLQNYKGGIKFEMTI